MNSCVLMAQIVRSPELRYLQDNQTQVAEMLVEFPGLRSEDPPATLKVVGWGNIASEIQQGYGEGDRVLLVGRLRMNTIERPEGFKEKRAELTVSNIHRLDGELTAQAPAYTTQTERPNHVVAMPTPPSSSSDSTEFEPTYEPTSVASESQPSQEDLDDIPF